MGTNCLSATPQLQIRRRLREGGRRRSECVAGLSTLAVYAPFLFPDLKARPCSPEARTPGRSYPPAVSPCPVEQGRIPGLTAVPLAGDLTPAWVPGHAAWTSPEVKAHIWPLVRRKPRPPGQEGRLRCAGSVSDSHTRAGLPSCEPAFPSAGVDGAICLQGEARTGDDEAFEAAKCCSQRWMAVTAGLVPGVLAPRGAGW